MKFVCWCVNVWVGRRPLGKVADFHCWLALNIFRLSRGISEDVGGSKRHRNSIKHWAPTRHRCSNMVWGLLFDSSVHRAFSLILGPKNITPMGNFIWNSQCWYECIMIVHHCVVYLDWFVSNCRFMLWVEACACHGSLLAPCFCALFGNCTLCSVLAFGNCHG